MHLNFHLALRHYKHMVTLMRVPDRQQPVLGVAYPQDLDPRQRLLEQWGIHARSPRRPEPATIDRPLDTRTQAILSYQVQPETRRTLNGELSDQRNPQLGSRQDTEAGIKGRQHLGVGHARFQVDSRRRAPDSFNASGHSATQDNVPRTRHGLNSPRPRHV